MEPAGRSGKIEGTFFASHMKRPARMVHRTARSGPVVPYAGVLRHADRQPRRVAGREGTVAVLTAEATVSHVDARRQEIENMTDADRVWYPQRSRPDRASDSWWL